MLEFVKIWLELKTDCSAVTALEYGLIAALIGGVMITGVTSLGNSINSKFATLAGTV